MSRPTVARACYDWWPGLIPGQAPGPALGLRPGHEGGFGYHAAGIFTYHVARRGTLYFAVRGELQRVVHTIVAPEHLRPDEESRGTEDTPDARLLRLLA